MLANIYLVERTEGSSMYSSIRTFFFGFLTLLCTVITTLVDCPLMKSREGKKPGFYKYPEGQKNRNI